jgi:hypothetical protein
MNPKLTQNRRAREKEGRGHGRLDRERHSTAIEAGLLFRSSRAESATFGRRQRTPSLVSRSARNFSQSDMAAALFERSLLHPAGLALYKKLCRYYYTLNPAATADYVNYYREIWDTDEPEDQK